MSFISTVLLQAAQTAAPAADTATKGGGSDIMRTVLLFGGMALVFYFLVMGPQRKKQKEQTKFNEDVKKGDKVATIGGIVGKVLELRTKTIVIETEGGGRLQMLRSAISFENTRALNAEDNKKEEKKEDKKA